jgi:hypothetical protein
VKLDGWWSVARAWSVAILVILVLDVAALLFGCRVLGQQSCYPFDTDEATHALSALHLASELHERDLPGFADRFLAQSTYPPLAATMRALAFVALGPSETAARGVSLVCLVLASALLVLISSEIDRSGGWFIALWAVALTLVAPQLLELAALCMLETPGLLVCLTALWLYIRASIGEWWPFELAAGLAAGAVMLVKYPYGLALLASIVVNEILSVLLGQRGQRAAGRRWSLLAVGAGVPLVAWFGKPSRMMDMVAYATSQPAETSVLATDNLLFYPLSIGLHYFPSWSVALVGLAGLVWAVRQIANPSTRALLLYLGAGLAMLVLKTQNEARFIAPFVPVVYLLGGWFLLDLWHKLVAAPKAARSVAGLVAAGVIISGTVGAWSGITSVRPMLRIAYETDPVLSDVAQLILDESQGGPLLVVDPWDQLSLQALGWTARSNSWPTSSSVQEMRSLRLPARPDIEEIAHLRRAMAAVRTVVVLANHGSSWARVRPFIRDREASVSIRRFDYEFFGHEQFERSRLVTSQDIERLRRQGTASRTVEVSIVRVEARPRGSEDVVVPAQEGVCTTGREPVLAIPSSLGAGDLAHGIEKLELDPSSARWLLAGWAGFEETPQGVSFVWAVGCESYVVLPCSTPAERELRIRLWPYHPLAGQQEVRVVLNGRVLSVTPLHRGPQVVSVSAPKHRWRKGPNLLALQFSRAVSPAESQPDSGDRRPLAAAVDWIHIIAHSTGAQ